jgi:hypothetical protein
MTDLPTLEMVLTAVLRRDNQSLSQYTEVYRELHMRTSSYHALVCLAHHAVTRNRYADECVGKLVSWVIRGKTEKQVRSRLALINDIFETLQELDPRLNCHSDIRGLIETRALEQYGLTPIAVTPEILPDIAHQPRRDQIVARELAAK